MFGELNSLTHFLFKLFLNIAAQASGGDDS
jgi:hypothetical protein